VGDLMVGYFGWQTCNVQNGDKPPVPDRPPPYKLPNLGALSPSLALGALGMPGLVYDQEFLLVTLKRLYK
jgi:NADPH-dependent curcumin reductase CurA